MHITSRLFATAGAALIAGLTLTACGGAGSSSSAAGSPAPAASGSTGTTAAPGTGTGSTGTTGSSGVGTGGSGTSTGAARCTVADLRITVQGPAARASEQEPAFADIHVVNTSAHTCTLAGFPGVQPADDQGKSAPLDAVRHQGFPATPVTLRPGGLANAELLYSDVNTQGSASGRLVCAVTGSKVAIILPNTTRQVRVPVTGGVDNGTLNVCGDLTVNPLSGVPND
ncbi:DUF4232 domain-containing protein [Streptacidiphilus jiangxiensis]|uniref:DUF4232 domain-containing protein n=1 Tax=Streptacidiphilus jiangxiensis TaxID=235985 RepID=A0A1H7N566_STRJI|nr:DUF4232 domain-containing protein [Streptacidiphilus jiangxiensis]SEL18766.1 Protein of unknown function [Streptacidiphilus jiangxiensis]